MFLLLTLKTPADRNILTLKLLNNQQAINRIWNQYQSMTRLPEIQLLLNLNNFEILRLETSKINRTNRLSQMKFQWMLRLILEPKLLSKKTKIDNLILLRIRTLE